MPWFANHSHGFGGPSFGYIVSFVVAAGVVGALARRGNDRSVLSSIGMLALGEAIILTIGTIWLANDLHLAAEVAVQKGVYPFVIGDVIKFTVAALLLPSAWKLARR